MKNAVILLTILFIGGCTTKPNEKLVIATAANTQFAIEKIAAEFEHKTGIETEVVIGSSGKHTAQIEAGAPYDVFISADLRYPTYLFDLGLTTGPPKVYAFGRLALWINSDTKDSTIKNVLTKSGKNIALPNPKTAPYGIAAFEALENLGLVDALTPKLVYGESVAQTNQYLISKTADVGFTSTSTVMAPQYKAKGRWLAVPDTLYNPIAQGVVIIKTTRYPSMAEQFLNYLFEPGARQIFEAYGYSINLTE